MLTRTKVKNYWKPIRYSGRSSDFISGDFVKQCAAYCKYCYVHRNGNVHQIKHSKNVTALLHDIQCYDTSKVKKPNQTHEKYITWDISCTGDFVSEMKYLQWQRIFDYFKNSDRDMGTMATKFTNNLLYTYNPEKKIRIRPSLMPQKYSTELELKTASIKHRLEAANKLFDSGYDVHFNLSPVIVHGKEWREEYAKLFDLANQIVRPDVLMEAQLEVIFMTYNPKHHLYNQAHGFDDELLWKPEWQEYKESQYGGPNLRYKHIYKADMIRVFKGILKEHFDLPIRYIF